MPKTKFSLVRGPSLILALAAAKFPIKWISGQPPYPMLPPDRALVIARSGVYEGKVRHGRVYHMRESGQRSVNAPDFAFWEDRACIRWHDADGPNSPTLKIKRKLLCDIWDRAVQNPPPRWRPKGVSTP